MSQITLSDGITTVEIDQHATLRLSQNFENETGGSVVQRFLNGNGIKQTHWNAIKKRITVSGAGVVPPGLGDIDYSLLLTITLREPSDALPDGPGKEYLIYSNGPAERWNINAGSYDWTLIGVEQ